MKKLNFQRLTALLLALVISFAALATTPLTAEAKSKKKKEVKITLQDTPGTWVQENNFWYFNNPEGERLSGAWVASGGKWYYLKSNGRMAANEWVTDKNIRYFISADGTMAENKWIQHNNAWYWLKSGGAMAANEWKQDGSAWYWLKSDGKMAANQKLTIDGKQESFGPSGAWIEPPKPPTPTTKEAQFAAEVLRLVNAEREKHGLNPVSGDDAILNAAAMVRAEEYMVYYYQVAPHWRPDGRTCETAYWDLGGSTKWRIWENGYWSWGSVAQKMTPSKVVNWWMNSQGHKDNILNPSHTHLGVGIYTTKGNFSCVQLFSAPKYPSAPWYY